MHCLIWSKPFQVWREALAWEERMVGLEAAGGRAVVDDTLRTVARRLANRPEMRLVGFDHIRQCMP